MPRRKSSTFWHRIICAITGRRTLAARRRHRSLGVECCESRALLTQVTLTPTADNSIFSESPDNSDGVGQYLYAGAASVGIRRALIKFDVSSLPPGAHIDSATLQLHISRDSPGADTSFDIHRATASWGEGTSDSDALNKGGRGAPATPNDATWHDRFFNVTAWGTDGGDFNPNFSASATVGASGFVQWTGTQLAADVQAWLNSPSTQLGWLIKEDDEGVPTSAKRFDSRQNPTASFRPQLTINYSGGATNQPPTLNAISNATIPEDAGQQPVNLSGISAGLGETQALSVSSQTDNPTLITNLNVNYTSPSATGILTYTPAADQNGTADITVTVRDAGFDGTFNTADDGTFSQTFSVIVTAVNDRPVRLTGSPAPISANEDSANTAAASLGLGSLTYGPGGGSDESLQTLTYRLTAIPSFVTITQSDGTTPVIANSPLTLQQLQGLTFKTIPNANGSSNLVWTVQDNGGTANFGVDTLTESLAVTIAAVNDPPVRTSGPPAAISVNEDSAKTAAVTLGLASLSYSPGGGSDESSQTLTYRLTTVPSFVNIVLADGSTIVIVGSPLTLAQFQGLRYKTVADANGSGNLTWTVQDNGGTGNGGNDTLTDSLAMTVIAVNDPPTLDPINDPTAIPLNSVQQTINLSGITAGPFESQTIAINAVSSNPNLIPNPTPHYTSPATTGSLTYTPVTDQSGSAVITVTVTDNGGTANGGNNTLIRTFTVLVNAADFVNQAPSFTIKPNGQSDQTATDFVGVVNVQAWATAISPGPPSEAAQTVTFIVDNDSHGLFSVQPAVSSNGTLTFTPLPNAHGTAVVTVQAHDNGGTANNGSDTSAAQTFNITITKPHRWHNTLHALDVDNNGQVTAKDALDIIARLNASGAGGVPANAPFGPPYFDTTGEDAVTANDAFAVITYLNAFGAGGAGPAGEGEAEPSIDAIPVDAIFFDLGAPSTARRKPTLW